MAQWCCVPGGVKFGFILFIFISFCLRTRLLWQLTRASCLLRQFSIPFFCSTRNGNSTYIENKKYTVLSGQPLMSSGQSSWLQIQRSGFDFRRYQIFWEVLGLERGPLSFVSTTEELLGRNSSGFGLENREYGLEFRRADHATSIHKSWH
jgi:hypothetical protein